MIIIVAQDILGGGLGQRNFDTSSKFTFIPDENELLVWHHDSLGVTHFMVYSIDYTEPNDHTVRFNNPIPPGERVTIWKVGLAARPGDMAFEDLSNITNDQSAAFRGADNPNALNVYLTESGHAAIDHSSIVPIPTLRADIDTNTHDISVLNTNFANHLITSNAHTAANISANSASIGFSNALTVQGVLDDADTNFYSKWIVEHFAGSGKHGPKVTVTQTGTDNALVIDHSGTGNDIVVDINKTGTAGGNVIDINNSGTGNSIYIQQNGTALAASIIQNTNSHGLYVEKSNTGNKDAAVITNYGSGSALNIQQFSSSVNGVGLLVEQSSNSDSIQVLTNGTGRGLYINKIASGGGDCIYINQSINATGYDIRGNSDNWHVDKNGNAKFNNLDSRTAFVQNTNNVAIPESWWTACTLTVTVPASGLTAVKLEAAVHTGHDNNSPIQVRICRNGSSIVPITQWEQGPSGHGGYHRSNGYFMLLDVPGPGTYTYTLELNDTLLGHSSTHFHSTFTAQLVQNTGATLP